MGRLYRPVAKHLVRCIAATALASGCSAGTLSTDEKDEFRSELDRLFEVDAGAPAEPSEPSEQPNTPAPAPTSPSTPNPSPSGMSPSAPTSTSPTPTAPNPSSPSPTPTTPAPTVPMPADPSAGFFDDCVIEVFETSCAGIACHHGGVFPPQLDSDDLYTLLTTARPTCSEAGANYVDLDSPETSYILQKLRGDQPASCGTVMPPSTSPALTDAQMRCMEDWFASL